MELCTEGDGVTKVNNESAIIKQVASICGLTTVKGETNTLRKIALVVWSCMQRKRATMPGRSIDEKFGPPQPLSQLPNQLGPNIQS